MSKQRPSGDRKLKPLNPTESKPPVKAEPSPENVQPAEELKEHRCPSCQSDLVHTIHDTGVSLYLACDRCLHTWKFTRKVVDEI